MPKQHKRSLEKYYWVKTAGYHNEYLPLLYVEKGWIVTVRDETHFLSDYKLELLFGKNCICREINKETDILSIDPEDNVFRPILVSADNKCRIDYVFMCHATIMMALADNSLIPMPRHAFIGFLKYPINKEDTNV